MFIVRYGLFDAHFKDVCSFKDSFEDVNKRKLETSKYDECQGDCPVELVEQAKVGPTPFHQTAVGVQDKYVAEHVVEYEGVHKERGDEAVPGDDEELAPLVLLGPFRDDQ